MCSSAFGYWRIDLYYIHITWTNYHMSTRMCSHRKHLHGKILTGLRRDRETPSLCVPNVDVKSNSNRIHANALFTFHIRTILSLEYKQSTYWFLNQCQRHFFRGFALHFSFIFFPILGYVRISVIHFSCHVDHVRSKFVVKLNGASLVEWHFMLCLFIFVWTKKIAWCGNTHIWSSLLG